MIPEPADQIGHRTTEAPAVANLSTSTFQDYKGRNVVERAFNKLKNWRGLATRYDCEDGFVASSRGLTHQGGVVLA